MIYCTLFRLDTKQPTANSEPTPHETIDSAIASMGGMPVHARSNNCAIFHLDDNCGMCFSTWIARRDTKKDPAHDNR